LPLTAALVALTAGGIALLPPVRSASLKLTDGKVLEGRSVRRDGDVYLLEIEGGSVVPVPVALVEEVGIGGEPEPEPPAEQVPEQVPGLTYGKPQQLAGTAVEAPSTHAQLAVLGEPARFRQNVVESNLKPSYWVPDPSEHNWAPSEWADGVVDPTWTPESAFDPDEDVLEDSRSTFQKGTIDSSWVPEDGFKK
jgi:hypothetical protein